MPSERADDQGRQQQRLRWHCRRALLELDLVFQRFWLKAGDGLGDEDAAALERLLETVSFEAADQGGKRVAVDAAYVEAQLGSLVKDQDLSRYIL